ncbi:MAG TPA: YncE family protein [Rhizomicrobium sp.]|nr:YncE family protein [Rhizomicrobium sp.]
MRFTLCSILCTALLCTALAMPASAAPPYRVTHTYTLGGDGGWDYLNLDPATGNLFITRGSHVMVVDPASGKLLADIAGLQGIHGTAFAGGYAYVSEGGADRIAVIDGKSLAKISEIPVGTRPDGILYDGFSKRIFTFNAASKDATAVDPASGKAVGTVALGGKPEAAVSDGAGTIFVNIEDKSELVAFDAATLAVKQHYPLAPCEEPSGMAADLAHGRVFSGCHNKMIAVTDMKTGKVVAQIPIGDGVDANRFDPATGLVFSSNGESGTLTVAHEDSPGKFTVLQQLETAGGARTMELDEKSHRVYLVTADRRPGTPTPDRPNPRPVPVPGTFRLLVVER